MAIITEPKKLILTCYICGQPINDPVLWSLNNMTDRPFITCPVCTKYVDSTNTHFTRLYKSYVILFDPHNMSLKNKIHLIVDIMLNKITSLNVVKLK